MRTILACLIILSALPCLAQIRSAEDRIRREQNNSRDALTIEQVKARKIDLAGTTFALRLRYSVITELEQIEPNRWQFELGDDDNSFATMANIPRAGAEAIGTIKDGDVVLARIKAGGDFVIEILGISEVGVWE
jgi:hypothetical protein